MIIAIAKSLIIKIGAQIIMSKIDIEKEQKLFEEAGGLKEYLENRKAKINILGVLGIFAVGFVLGVILF